MVKASALARIGRQVRDNASLQLRFGQEPGEIRALECRRILALIGVRITLRVALKL
jgi:hypothetical protein